MKVEDEILAAASAAPSEVDELEELDELEAELDVDLVDVDRELARDVVEEPAEDPEPSDVEDICEEEEGEVEEEVSDGDEVDEPAEDSEVDAAEVSGSVYETPGSSSLASELSEPSSGNKGTL